MQQCLICIAAAGLAKVVFANKSSVGKSSVGKSSVGKSSVGKSSVGKSSVGKSMDGMLSKLAEMAAWG